MKLKRRMLSTPAALAFMLLLAWLPVLAETDENLAYGDDYQPGNYGRVSYQENGVTIQRAAADPGAPPVGEVGMNAPVFPGDTVATGPDQRLEVQLAGGSLVRVDRVSEITFLALPDPYAEFQDHTILQLVEGTIQITSFLGEKEEFRVDTPSCSVYLLGDGDFRIEASRQGRSRVISHRGVAEVVGDGGSVLLRAGMLSEAYAGSYPSTPEPFNTFMADNFDGWVDGREASYRVRDRYPDDSGYSAEVYQELPREVQPYYGELSRQGRWDYTSDYGYIWYPSGMASSWRPYYDGYWEYGPHGYFWVSHEPWGWAPYHYGRWAWVAGYGWGWIPGRVFGGAWVAWSWGSLHVGWAPLSYWNYPVYVGVSRYYYYDPYCWTFINYSHINKRHYPRYAVPVGSVGSGLARTAVVTRPPRVSPRQLADSPDWRTKAVRQAQADGRARIKPTYRERRPERNMRDVDNAIARRASSRSPDRSVRPGPGRGTTDPGRVDTSVRTSPRSGRSGGDPRTGLAETGRGTTGTRLRSHPRRISASDVDPAPGRGGTTPRSIQPAPGNRADRNSSAGDRSGRSTPPPRVQPRQATDGQSAERVRDLYRKMSGPRTTRERAGSAGNEPRAGRSTTRSRSSSQGARPSTVRKPTPSSPRKSSTSARPSGSSAKPRSGARSGSGGSKPRSSASGSGSSARGGSSARSGGSSARGSSGSRSGSSARGSSGSRSGSSGKGKSGGGGKKRN